MRARRAGGSTTGGGISIGSSAPPGKRSGLPLSGPCDTNNLVGRRRVDGRKIVEDGAETAQGHGGAGVDDLAPQHLFASIAARAEAKLGSKNKNASTRDRGVGARGNFYQVTVGLRQNCGAPRGVRTGGHGLAINWFLSTDLENTRRILDAHEEVCVCFGRVAAVPAQLQTAGYYPSSSFIFTRVVSRRARAV